MKNNGRSKKKLMLPPLQNRYLRAGKAGIAKLSLHRLYRPGYTNTALLHPYNKILCNTASLRLR